MTKAIQKETFSIIMSTVNQLVDFVKPTYGPAGNKVIIDKQIYRSVLDDGVQITRDFDLNDEAENAVLKVIKEVAIKTNDRVGDGTTSSLIMLQAIMKEVEKKGLSNRKAIVTELKKGLLEAKAELLKSAKKITTKDELQKVARVSFDDPEMSATISDLIWALGGDGSITVDKSQTLETTHELTEGITWPAGYASPYMMSNPERNEAVIEKPYILLTDYRLTEASDVVPIMTKLAEKQILNLVIVAEHIEGTALATLIINRVQGKFNTLAIMAPQGDRRQTLEDMALLTGATVFSEAKGNKLENAEIEMLGRADRIIAKEKVTTIIGGKGEKPAIKKAIADLRGNIKTTPPGGQKDALERRLGMLTNKVAVIKVGASTDNEQKALKYKIEDSVNATRAAYNGGIVCGAGLSLFRLKTSSPILNAALKYPFKQLLKNCEIEEEIELKTGEAYNVVSGVKGNFVKVGVVDPVEVLIAGIESAVSIASLLVDSVGGGILVEEKPKEDK